MDSVQPIRFPQLATKIKVNLPAGVAYPKGTLLGNITSAVAASEVRTLTITGAPTGFNGTLAYTADKVYLVSLANLVTTIPTATEMQTAHEAIFGVGNVTVTKSSLVYTIVFGGDMTFRRVGNAITSTFTFTAGTTPAATYATTTAGTTGVGQFAAYNDALSDGSQVAKVILETAFVTNPAGYVVAENGSTGDVQGPSAWSAGYFRVGDLVGLDAAGLVDLGKLVEGTALTGESILKM